MNLEFLNCVWLYLFYYCLIGFRIDTSRLPFSLVVRLFPFYSVDFWIYTSHEVANGHYNRRTDITIPFICDIEFIQEIN